LLTRAGLINFNGQTPSIRLDKGKEIRDADSLSYKMTLQLLMSDTLWGTRPFNFNEYLPRTVSPGEAHGIAIGGNVDTFVHLIGTSYFPNVDGAILFIEDVHKGGEELGRMLLHLQLAGVLNAVNGIVVGEFAEVPKKMCEKEPAIEDVLEEYFDHGPPCVYGFPFSHGPLTGPIAIGAMCHIDADLGVVSFEFAMGS